MLIIGEATFVKGQGIYGKSLPSQFCHESKTTLENKVYCLKK